MRILSKDDKKRLKNGDVPLLLDYLKEYDLDTKTHLVSFKPNGSDFDNVLKGKCILISELISLLS
jgi:hypothetical protein